MFSQHQRPSLLGLRVPPNRVGDKMLIVPGKDRAFAGVVVEGPDMSKPACDGQGVVVLFTRARVVDVLRELAARACFQPVRALVQSVHLT